MNFPAVRGPLLIAIHGLDPFAGEPQKLWLNLQARLWVEADAGILHHEQLLGAALQ